MSDRLSLLTQISEVSFVLTDLTLYLDTHPLDDNALNQFEAMTKQRQSLLTEYAEQFEPLTMDCVCITTNNQTKQHTKYPGQAHFTWSDGPLPWDSCVGQKGGI